MGHALAFVGLRTSHGYFLRYKYNQKCWGMAAPFPPAASKDALQAKEPPTSEVSEDILLPGNLRGVACGGP